MRIAFKGIAEGNYCVGSPIYFQAISARLPYIRGGTGHRLLMIRPNVDQPLMRNEKKARHLESGGQKSKPLEKSWRRQMPS